MKSRFLVALACICILPWRAQADVPLGTTTAHFATQSEGRQILTAKDEFIQRLGPFDRSARMKTDKAVSEEEFLQFVGRNVIDWTQEEAQRVQTAIEAIHPLLRELPLSLPRPVQFVRTTGAEQGNAAYTQGTGIVLHKDDFAKSPRELQKLICHELFHVLSRHNPELRERLYRLIGFTKCNEIDLPPELQRRKITNPDAPRNDYYIRVQVDGRQSCVVPLLISRVEKYDIERGGEFFAYIKLQFLVMQKEIGSANLKTVFDGSSPKVVGMERLSGFFEQVGRNTDYIIHPEEILADNFALLVLGEYNVPSPEIPQRMKEVLMRKPIP
jgi:Domain of unknown function (DUF4157)